MQKTFSYSIFILVILTLIHLLLSIVFVTDKVLYFYLAMPFVLTFFMIGFKRLFPKIKERLLVYTFTIYHSLFFIVACFLELDLASAYFTKLLFYGCFGAFALLIICSLLLKVPRLAIVSMVLVNLNLWLTLI